MIRKSVVLFIFSFLFCKLAWAGSPVPEIPVSFTPFVLLGLSGMAFAIRRWLDK